MSGAGSPAGGQLPAPPGRNKTTPRSTPHDRSFHAGHLPANPAVCLQPSCSDRPARPAPSPPALGRPSPGPRGFSGDGKNGNSVEHRASVLEGSRGFGKPGACTMAGGSDATPPRLAKVPPVPANLLHLLQAPHVLAHPITRSESAARHATVFGAMRCWVMSEDWTPRLPHAPDLIHRADRDMKITPGRITSHHRNQAQCLAHMSSPHAMQRALHACDIACSETQGPAACVQRRRWTWWPRTRARRPPHQPRPAARARQSRSPSAADHSHWGESWSQSMHCLHARLARVLPDAGPGARAGAGSASHPRHLPAPQPRRGARHRTAPAAIPGSAARRRGFRRRCAVGAAARGVAGGSPAGHRPPSTRWHGAAVPRHIDESSCFHPPPPPHVQGPAAAPLPRRGPTPPRRGCGRTRRAALRCW